MTRALYLVAVATLAAGCPAEEPYQVVTVTARPAVQNVQLLRVGLANAGSSIGQDFDLDGNAFPVTFSVSPSGRVGELAITVDALDASGLTVARGQVSADAAEPATELMLEPTDFVVNTEYADDQELSNYYQANGYQLAASPTGTWTVVYNAACTTPCNVFARRFDVNAQPLQSQVAATSQGFPMSEDLTTSFSTPSVATAGANTVAIWNAHQPQSSPAVYSIECRGLDANGAALSPQVRIALDELPFVASVSPMPDGNFAVVWDGRITTDAVRRAIVRPNCTTVTLGEVAVAPLATNSYDRSSVAANADRILYAWLIDGSVHIRPAMINGTYTDTALLLVPKTATEVVEFVRVAPLASGFAVAVRWAAATGTTGPGRIDLWRVSNAGLVVGTPVRVTDRAGSDFANSQSFGITARSDGTLFVVWHACGDRGDGNLCGVFGRLHGATGEPLADEFVLSSTTTGDQIGPSAVALPDGAFATAWTDSSLTAPDTSGTAVRARVIYPALSSSAR